MDGDGSRPTSVPPGSWQFKPGDTANPGQTGVQAMPHRDDYTPVAAGQPHRPDPTGVTWTASEFIAHHKSFGWYALLALIAAALSAGTFFATKDKISAIVIIVVAIVFGIYAARKPRTLSYTVDSSGLLIAQKFYPYAQFRSFAIVDEDAFASIVFMPLKRFMPLLTIYYDPKDAPKIIETLSAHLPVDTHQLDPIDQLMRRIRF